MGSVTLKRILLVEDNAGDARLIQEMFRDHHVELSHTDCMRDAEAFLMGHSVDVVLLDLGLPDAQGLDAVRRTIAIASRTPIVVLSGSDDESLAVEAMQRGAQDYLIKGQLEARELIRALRYAIERKLIEEALFAEKERAQVTLDSIGDGVICTDLEGNITFLNRGAETMTGWSLAEILQKPMTEVIQILDSTTRAASPNLLERTKLRDRIQPHSSSSLLVRRNGDGIPVEDSVSPIRDRVGEIVGFVYILRDVSATRAMKEQITHSAHHDFLTGLPNRLLLNDRITQSIGLARLHGHHLAVLFLDLDGFKHVNDSLGHPKGDRLLQAIGASLVGSIEAPVTVSRQGGDEFVVLVPEVTNAVDVTTIALRMLKAVEAAHIEDHHDLRITTSIGVSIYPNDGTDAETLIKNADTAMYQAKDGGRQSYKFFTPAMNTRAVQRQRVEEHLRRALERQEFELYYQPKINLISGSISGVEALIRWNHPTLGEVSPAVFIPIAEDSGLILPIGKWVLAEACKHACEWQNAGLPGITMAVNVSAVQFRNDDFLESFMGILDESGLDPRCLEVEVTESALMKRAEPMAFILQTLRSKGIRISIDDFGTGYCSLSYLRKFPLDSMKIDQSFVRQISTTPDETMIVSAIINMAHSLGLRVIAEGVETEEELAFLRERHCEEAQGYYFSRPIPAHALVTLLGSPPQPVTTVPALSV
jgi:diguanylate cyclase (GGDEF)-like protein/PAS domain S-box-containing protein